MSPLVGRHSWQHNPRLFSLRRACVLCHKEEPYLGTTDYLGQIPHSRPTLAKACLISPCLPLSCDWSPPPIGETFGTIRCGIEARDKAGGTLYTTVQSCTAVAAKETARSRTHEMVQGVVDHTPLLAVVQLPSNPLDWSPCLRASSSVAARGIRPWLSSIRWRQTWASSAVIFFPRYPTGRSR